LFEDLRYWVGRHLTNLSVFLVGFLASLALTTVMALVSVCIGGWVLQHLWYWFVVPTFHVNWLTLPQAMGLGLIVRFPVYYTAGWATSNEARFKQALMTIIIPVVMFIIGWIIHILWM
jgi:hypothetical protein